MKAAIVQSGPIYMDLEASMSQALGLLEQAAEQGANLTVFGETWLSGYPAWLDVCPGAGLWDHGPVKSVFARMYANAITVPGPEVGQLCKWAKKFKQLVCIGVNEKVRSGPGNGTLYNSMLLISPEGRLLNHHRKLMPTYTERMVYGQGDPRGLQAVETPYGRVGGLICWEHWMPLSRQAMHDSGEHLHIALWPTVKEMNHVASRHYAFEGRCYVIAAGQVMFAREIPKELELPEHLQGKPDAKVMTGGSAVYGPDGSVILAPQYDWDGMLLVDLPPLENVVAERMNLDVSGHYQRGDVFDFGVRKREMVRKKDSD
ncbi:MAG: carbon-nitrogen hydrolase family protein [Bacteroidota bacterium]